MHFVRPPSQGQASVQPRLPLREVSKPPPHLWFDPHSPERPVVFLSVRCLRLDLECKPHIRRPRRPSFKVAAPASRPSSSTRMVVEPASPSQSSQSSTASFDIKIELPSPVMGGAGVPDLPPVKAEALVTTFAMCLAQDLIDSSRTRDVLCVVLPATLCHLDRDGDGVTLPFLPLPRRAAVTLSSVNDRASSSCPPLPLASVLLSLSDSCPRSGAAPRASPPIPLFLVPVPGLPSSCLLPPVSAVLPASVPLLLLFLFCGVASASSVFPSVCRWSFCCMAGSRGTTGTSAWAATARSAAWDPSPP
jgi:hypothetical protein